MDNINEGVGYMIAGAVITTFLWGLMLGWVIFA